MTAPRLAARLAAGETIFCGWSQLAEPLAGEALARAGFDAVCLDGQHGMQDFRAFRDSVTAVAGAGASPVARVPYGAFAEIGRAIDMAVEAIICPMVNTREDAERLVRVMKFPPIGARSWGPQRATMLWEMEPADFLARANELTLAFAMIETEEAVGNLDDILSVPGIDGVFVGPNDLSISYANGERVNHLSHDVWNALDVIAARMTEHGKYGAIYVNSPDLVPRYAQLGFRIFAGGSDLNFMRAGAQTLVQAMKSAR